MTSDSTPVFALEKEALKTEIETGLQVGVDHLEDKPMKRKPVEKYHNTRHLLKQYRKVAYAIQISESDMNVRMEMEHGTRLSTLEVNAQNLTVLLGDGVYQGLSETEFSAMGLSYDGVIFSDGETQVVYYNQLDERWKYELYGTDTIGGYACGPTAMSIVVSSLTSETVDPPHMAQWAYENGYWCSGNGSYHSLIPGAAEAWGLSVEGCTATEPQRIVDALADGKLVVAIMTKGHFTSSGHFIVLRGCTADGEILVADPASYQRSEKSWDLSIILNEASKSAGAGGPFWIIGN